MSLSYKNIFHQSNAVEAVLWFSVLP